MAATNTAVPDEAVWVGSRVYNEFVRTTPSHPDGMHAALVATYPYVAAVALREAASEQRRLSADARTDNGQAEHADIADWLDERAAAVCPDGAEQRPTISRPEVDVVMDRPLPPTWGGEETSEGTHLYHAAWDSVPDALRLWVGPYTAQLNEGWAVSIESDVVSVVMRCTADQAVEWAKQVTAAVRESRAELGVVHLIADGAAVTTCCGRTPFELPRSERITVDPSLESCKQAGDLAEQIAEVLFVNDNSRDQSAARNWDRAYPITRRPYLELAEKVLALTNGAGS